MSDGDLFREVESDIRRDRAKAMWDRYGVYGLVVAIAIVAIVGGYNAWTAWQQKRAAQAGADFTQALNLTEEGKADEAKAAFAKLASAGPRGYAALAQFQLAAQLAKSGDHAKATETYEQIAGAAGLDGILKDFARIQAATLLIDRTPLDEMKQRLEPLANGQGPWRYSARELLALSAFRAGDMADAEKRFTELLADAQAPQNMRNRAEIMMGLVVSATAGKQTSDAAPAPAVPAATTAGETR